MRLQDPTLRVRPPSSQSAIPRSARSAGTPARARTPARPRAFAPARARARTRSCARARVRSPSSARSNRPLATSAHSARSRSLSRRPLAPPVRDPSRAGRSRRRLAANADDLYPSKVSVGVGVWVLVSVKGGLCHCDGDLLWRLPGGQQATAAPPRKVDTPPATSESRVSPPFPGVFAFCLGVVRVGPDLTESLSV